MTRARRALALPALAALALAGCDRGAAGAPGPGPRKGQGPAPVPVAAVPVIRQTVREVLRSHAPLEPESEVDVTARAAGRVVKLEVETGDRVHAGQVLALLDDARQRLGVRQAELSLQQAKTSLERTEVLASKGLSSGQQRDQAEEAVKQAELALETARLDLSDVQIVSPIAGLVTDRKVSLGSELTKGAAAFQVADPDPLLAKVAIPEAQATRVAPGQHAVVTVEGRPHPLQGRVLRVAPRVDLGSGTVEVTVAVEPEAGLRLNRFASVEIVTGEHPRALTIPLAALALRGEEGRVLVVQGATKGGGLVVRYRSIVTGVRMGERVEVLRGLAAGERVVTAGPDDLRDGAPVTLVGQPQAGTVAAETSAAAGTKVQAPAGP